MGHDDKTNYERATEALMYIQRRAGDFRPLTAIVLGSGLGAVADIVEEPLVLSAVDIPWWPTSTAPGHAGRIILGKIEGRSIAMLQGRVHYYEGHPMETVTFPVRVMGMMGVRQYVATNASGGVAERLRPGDIVAVEDHINLMGTNPLIGRPEPRWNVRFPDMCYAYSARLTSLLESSADELGIELGRGVYAAFTGPSYETPAEVRAARTLGADLVGMSTVPEVIVACAMGIETAVLSCVANKAAGLSDEDLTEEAVLDVMAGISDRIAALLRSLMRRLQCEEAKG